MLLDIISGHLAANLNSHGPSLSWQISAVPQNLPTDDITGYPDLSPRLALPTGLPKRAEEDMALLFFRPLGVLAV